MKRKLLGKKIIAGVTAVLSVLLIGSVMISKPAEAEVVEEGNMIELGTTYSDYVTDPFESDNRNVKYTFVLPAAGRMDIDITVDLSDGESHDLNYAVYSPEGKMFSENLVDLEECGVYTVTLPGTYSIEFSEGWSNGLGDYTEFTVTVSFEAWEETYPETLENKNNTNETASVIETTADIKGVFGVGDKVDKYKFDAKKNGKLSLKFSKGVEDMSIHLSNEFGDYVFVKPFEGAGTYTFDIEKGTYYLSLSCSNWGEYHFTSTLSGLTKTKLKKVSGTTKRIKVKWTRKADVSGYVIQISSDSKFEKNCRKYTIYDKAISEKTIQNNGKIYLKGKTYYVRIRTYMDINNRRFYSAWSEKKKLKIK